MRDSESGPMDQAEDARLIKGLRNGDESTFVQLIDTHGETMLRIAHGMVSSPAVAEEVVQETWLAVFTGIHRVEGRSSLRTWVFRILMNTANTQRTRDARSVPFSDLARELEADEPAVDPDRFFASGLNQRLGAWSAQPDSWGGDPEARLLSSETLELIRRTIDTLPAGQRAVVTLRDVQGWTSDEVSQALGVSRGNQRVLLHRARGRLRAALEAWMRVPRPASV
jgi:RNA polymerase sigma-70 factor (ECF subfamily)